MGRGGQFWGCGRAEEWGDGGWKGKGRVVVVGWGGGGGVTNTATIRSDPPRCKAAAHALPLRCRRPPGL